jgi:hypothetical protein
MTESSLPSGFTVTQLLFSVALGCVIAIGVGADRVGRIFLRRCSESTYSELLSDTAEYRYTSPQLAETVLYVLEWTLVSHGFDWHALIEIDLRECTHRTVIDRASLRVDGGEDAWLHSLIGYSGGSIVAAAAIRQLTENGAVANYEIGSLDMNSLRWQRCVDISPTLLP